MPSSSLDPPAFEVPPRSQGGVTLRQVAERARVSMMSVSRAINSPGAVAPSTLQRVNAAIAETGYVPNLVAGGLRASKSYLVTALVPTTTGPLFAEMIHSLTEALDARGYQVMLGEIGYARSREDELLRAIVGRRPDGIVLTGVMHSPEGRRMLLASGIPIVETWDFTPQPIDMLVGLTHEALGAAVCRYLHAKGRTRLAVLSGDDERAARRKEGFFQCAHDLGLATPEVYLGQSPTTHADGREGLATLLGANASLDGIFCSSDMLALGVLTETRLRGIGVPTQLSVVGFGDIDFAETVSPTLTTVRIDGTRIGKVAAQFIVDRAEGRRIDTPVVDIGFQIVERESA